MPTTQLATFKCFNWVEYGNQIQLILLILKSHWFILITVNLDLLKYTNQDQTDSDCIKHIFSSFNIRIWGLNRLPVTLFGGRNWCRPCLYFIAGYWGSWCLYHTGRPWRCSVFVLLTPWWPTTIPTTIPTRCHVTNPILWTTELWALWPSLQLWLQC